jgi:predicted SprT family Zn-dependent metalloprotease
MCDESNDLDVNDFLEMIESEDDQLMNLDALEGDTWSDETSKTYLCDICGNYFFTERALTRHIKEQILQCTTVNDSVDNL